MEIIDTDVLIVGSGGAGLRAAIETQRYNVKAVIVCKGGFPSGCSSYAMGAMQVAFDLQSFESQLRDTVVGGRFINNQVLVKIMIEKSVEAAKELEEFGTYFEKEDGKYRLFAFGGYSQPRAIVSSKPYAGGWIEGLVKRVRELDIEVIDHVMATRLLTIGREVVGVVGLNLKTGNILTVRAKSTILATGGAGWLYPITTNPPGITGDGYAIAYQAGAELTDMEFIQFRACIVYPSILRGQPPPADGMVSSGGRFYNVLCERYMKKYDPVRCENVTRDLIAIYTYKEIKEGRGTSHGGVYNDLSGVPEKELERFESFMQACRAAGIDPKWQPIEWAPGAHHFMGGIRIDEYAKTSLNGLFACGEVTAGIHGANRLAGNALTDTLVFGKIAGTSAAKRAISRAPPEIPMEQVESEISRISSFYKREEGMDYRLIRIEVQNIMNNYVGVTRKGSELIKALNELDRISKQIQNLYIASEEKTYRELGELLETINLITVGRIVAKAALIRTESRGAHYREDYPRENSKKWLNNIVFFHHNGEMLVEIKPVNLAYIKQ
ncbi:MAG: FAD-binding protein [Candidatus Methanomethylicia archaeon]